MVKVSRNGGGSWITDDNLTNELTRKGKLLYGGDEYRIQITQISFDPYNQNRILIGTRDAGIIISEDGGYNWSTIPHSAVIQYITNFFFKHNNIVVVSSYGRGLWKIDLNGYPESFPFEYYCLGDCIKRRPDIPEIYDDPIDWADKEVVIVLNGKINGLITSQGEIKTVTVTLGSLIKCYIGNSEDYVELNIIESDEGEGFNDLKGCMAALENQEIIKGIILKEKKLFGTISGKKEFKEVKEEKNKKNEGEKKEKQTTVKKSEADFKQPYLFVTTSIPLAGEPILGDDRIINLFGTGFSLDAAYKDVTIILDGQKMEKGTKVSDKGNIRFELVVPEEISEGKHIVEVKQKTSKEEIVVTDSFLIAAIDDFD